MDHRSGLSPEEPCRIECHYCSTHVQVHGLKGDFKAEFLQQANLIGIRTVANFITEMATMTVHIFFTYAYCDPRQYM